MNPLNEKSEELDRLLEAERSEFWLDFERAISERNNGRIKAALDDVFEHIYFRQIRERVLGVEHVYKENEELKKKLAHLEGIIAAALMSAEPVKEAS